MKAQRIEESSFQNLAVMLVVLAVCYNALLALVNANLFGLSFKIVALVEFSLLLGAISLILLSGLVKQDTVDILLILFGFCLALLISVLNQRVFIDALRDLLIITIFVMLGRRMLEESVHKVFLIISAIVAIFLLLEIFLLDIYVQLFEPAKYYAATRGIEIAWWNSTGLFNTAVSFASRFNYGVFDGPRTSSIFLEQVSLSNFAIILSVYIAVFWQRINYKHVFFMFLLIVAILITARSRTALAIVILVVVSFRVLPFIPRYMGLLMLPTVIAIAIAVYLSYPVTIVEDTLKGRISHSGRLLMDFDFTQFFALNVNTIGMYEDSGVPHLIVSYSLVGALLVWIYLAFISGNDGPRHRRFSLLMNGYLYATLLVSASVFTIKTAALIWIVAGFLSVHTREQLQGYK